MSLRPYCAMVRAYYGIDGDGKILSLKERHLKTAFSTRMMKQPPVDLPMLLLTYLGIDMSNKIERDVMDMRKEFTFKGYTFALGIIDNANYSVGLLSWPGLKDFTTEELRKYRYVMFQAQAEITKMQNDIDRVLRESLLD